MIAVVAGDEVIVHRVVAMARKRWLLLRGDANVLCDVPLLDAQAIIGRVEAIERNGALLTPSAPPSRRAARISLAAMRLLLRVNVPLARAAARLAILARRLLITALTAARGHNPS